MTSAAVNRSPLNAWLQRYSKAGLGVDAYFDILNFYIKTSIKRTKLYSTNQIYVYVNDHKQTTNKMKCNMLLYITIYLKNKEICRTAKQSTPRLWDSETRWRTACYKAELYVTTSLQSPPLYMLILLYQRMHVYVVNVVVLSWTCAVYVWSLCVLCVCNGEPGLLTVVKQVGVHVDIYKTVTMWW